MLIACGLLTAAAAVDERVAALVLALWVAALVVLGIRLPRPPDDKQAPPAAAEIVRRPVLVLARLSTGGRLGATRTLPVVASPAAIAVLDSRPRG